MRDIMKNRRIIYLVIGLLMISIIQYSPVEHTAGMQRFLFGTVNVAAMTVQDSMLQIQETAARLGQKAVVQPGAQDEAAAQAKISAPAGETVSDYKVPDNIRESSLENQSGEGTAARQTNKQRYQLLRILILTLAVVLYPCQILWTAYKDFCGLTKALCQNITYIHQLDGKKGKRVSVTVE